MFDVIAELNSAEVPEDDDEEEGDYGDILMGNILEEEDSVTSTVLSSEASKHSMALKDIVSTSTALATSISYYPLSPREHLSPQKKISNHRKTRKIQCQHIIPAINDWAEWASYTTTCTIATQFSEHGSMDDLTTVRVALIRKQCGSLM